MKHINLTHLAIRLVIVVLFPIISAILFVVGSIIMGNMLYSFYFFLFLLLCYALTAILILFEGIFLYIKKKWDKGNSCFIAGVINAIFVILIVYYFPSSMFGYME